MDRLRKLLRPGMGLALIWILGLIFFVRNAHLQLASDDLGWLRGEAPTVFDQYRIIPRLFFILLYKIAGPNPIAALTVIFFFHSINMLLIKSLAEKLFKDSAVALMAACIFMINPITLSTLTWISCFSYVLGATLALFSLSLFWLAQDSPKKWWLWTGAVTCYGIGLFSSHELLFVPVIFFCLSWLWGGETFKHNAMVAAIALGLGVFINFFFYNFERFGVEITRLFSLDFTLAIFSSVLSFGLSLGLAYPLSFFVSPTHFLQLVFLEPFRWIITFVVLIGILFMLDKSRKHLKLWLVLIISFIALITPYIIRLYLMPRDVHYDISYVLTGRVFYLPFVVISILEGALFVRLWRHSLYKTPLYRLLAFILPAGAYLYALCVLYNAEDFRGLSVLPGNAAYSPVSWNPYSGSQPVWFAVLALAVLIICIWLAFFRKQLRSSR